MRNDKYWTQRFELLERSALDKGLAYLDRLESEYRKASTRLRLDIERWYARLAANNDVDIVSARRLLSKAELEEFKWSVEEYIKRGEENAITAQWAKQLENASARVHISYLEALQYQLQAHIELLFGNQLDSVDALLRSIYTDHYYRTAYEIQRGVGVGRQLFGYNEQQLERLLSKPWTADARTFSDRIWDNKDQLVNTVHTELVQSIVRGDPPDRATAAIARKMDVSRSQAGRLVMTESAYFAAESQAQCYRDLDIDRYEIVATLDEHTSELCQGLDGVVLPMSGYKAGVTAPPFHPWCRTTTIPHFDDNYTTRAARDRNGKTYQVPGNLKYSDWYKMTITNNTKGAKT